MSTVLLEAEDGDVPTRAGERRRQSFINQRDVHRSCGLIVGLLLLLVGASLMIRGTGAEAELGARVYSASQCRQMLADPTGHARIAKVGIHAAKYQVDPRSCQRVTTDTLDDVPLKKLCTDALSSVDETPVNRVDNLCDGCVKDGGRLRGWTITLKICRIILYCATGLSLISYLVSASSKFRQLPYAARMVGFAFSCVCLLTSIVCEFGISDLRKGADDALRSVLMATPFFFKLASCADYSELRTGMQSDFIHSALIMNMLASMDLFYFSYAMRDRPTAIEEEELPLMSPVAP